MMALQVELGPRELEVDGARVTILEVLKTSTPWLGDEYHVVVRIRLGGVTSKPFTIDVRGERELIEKLRVEIAKMKLFKFIHGEEEFRRVAER